MCGLMVLSVSIGDSGVVCVGDSVGGEELMVSALVGGEVVFGLGE